MIRKVLKDSAYYQGIDAGSTYLVAGLLRVRIDPTRRELSGVFFCVKCMVNRGDISVSVPFGYLLLFSICSVNSKITAKKNQPQGVRLADIGVNKTEFTNNVSWLGDPRLIKGHLIYSSICANFYSAVLRRMSPFLALINCLGCILELQNAKASKNANDEFVVIRSIS